MKRERKERENDERERKKVGRERKKKQTSDAKSAGKQRVEYRIVFDCHCVVLKFFEFILFFWALFTWEGM